MNTNAGRLKRGAADMEDPTVASDKLTGLPVVECMHPAAANEEMSPARAADILIAQEAEWATSGKNEAART